MQCVSSIILGIGAVDIGASLEIRQVLPPGSTSGGALLCICVVIPVILRKCVAFVQRLKLKLCRSLGNCTVGSYSELTASLSSMVRQQIFTSA